MQVCTVYEAEDANIHGWIRQRFARSGFLRRWQRRGPYWFPLVDDPVVLLPKGSLRPNRWIGVLQLMNTPHAVSGSGAIRFI